jgi:hypothetical protein
MVAAQLRVGGYVLNDNPGPIFLTYIRDPANGFISITLPIKRGTELALRSRSLKRREILLEIGMLEHR